MTGRAAYRLDLVSGGVESSSAGFLGLTKNMRIHHLINGEPVEGREYFQTINPATQEVLAELAAGTASEIDAAVSAAKAAFPKWAALPATERRVRALVRRAS